MKRLALRVQLLALFCLTILISHAQETNNWYFGSAAGFPMTGLRVDFTSGSPVVSTGYPIRTEEGSSSISDASGNPLFYTDGVSIWDASTNVAFSTTLAGGSSSTQSAIIMPKPGAVNQWLVFTSGTQGNPGVTYYTVSGSPGSFSISAGTTLVAAGIPGEGLFIIGNSVSPGAFWVISRDDGATGQIRAFDVSNTGVVNTTPVLSTLSGPSFTNTTYSSEIGTIKSNTCQTKLAFSYLNGHVDLADFNAATGTLVANSARRITVTSGGGNSGSYGLEFSTNDAYLYITNLAGGEVYRHDIAANTTSVFGTVAAGNEAGQLQTAPDGHIYVANRNASPATAPNYLGRINNPGLAGATWTPQAVLLSGVTYGGNFGFVYRGLPTFPKSLVVNTLDVNPGNGAYCTGTAIPLSFTFAGTIAAGTISWTATGGGQTFTPGGASSTNASPTVSFSTTGTKTVTLTFNDFCGRTHTKDMTFVISNPKTPAGTVACSNPNLVLDNPAADPDEPNYIWYANSVSDANIIGVGTPVNYAVSIGGILPSQICLGVANGSQTVSTGSNSIASSNTLGGAAEVSPKTSSTFDVLADQLILRSFNIGFRFAGTYTYNITIRNGASAVVYSNTFTTVAGAGVSFPVTVNTTLPKGTGYTISIATTAPSAAEQMQRGAWTGATNAGEITYNAVASPGTAVFANLVYDYQNYTVTPVCSAPTCISVTCTLPVELLDFTGKQTNAGVVLNWITSAEINNDYFTVLKSTDGINFTTIGKVHGHGTSNQVNDYTFTDNTSGNGIVYYKLEQYDYDGNSTSSKIIQVSTGISGTVFTVSPNPSTESFKISFSDLSGGELEVLNTIGQVIATRSISAGTASVEIGAELAKGAYVLKLSGAGSVSTKLVIKE